jgi:hypothetical protein
MFIRQKKNKSGSVSVQIISKCDGKYKLLQTIGSATSPEGIGMLMQQASYELSKIQSQPSLFPSSTDANIEGFRRHIISSGSIHFMLLHLS